MNQRIMKKRPSYFIFAIPAILFAVLLSSCKKDEVEPNLPPEIHDVYYLTDRLEPLELANYAEWILIRGANLKTTREVIFNTVRAADSLIYADDTSVTVKIPTVLPDPANNPVTVTTQYGSVTYNFKILQPAPLFTDFSPIAGDAGDVVTLSGNYFDGVERVMFGDQAAEIVSSTKTELKVKVPAGFQFGPITIETPSGSVTSEKVFGFQYLLFGDALASGWWSGPWGGSHVLNTEKVRRGTSSIKYEATGTWGGAKWGKNAPDLNLNGFSGFKVSLLGGTGTTGKKVKIYLNSLSDKGYEILLKENEWQDFQIPLTNLGNPATLNTVTLQEFSGHMSDFYIDDVGFY